MNKILKESFNNTIGKSIGTIILTIIAVLSGLCTILGITIHDFSPFWLSLTALVVFLSTLFYIIYRFFKITSEKLDEKDKEFNEIRLKLEGMQKEQTDYKDYFSFIRNLSDSYSAINKMIRNGRFNETTFQRELLIFCNKLSESFELLNSKDPDLKNSKYSVSIKVVLSEADLSSDNHTNEIEVINSFRNTSSFQDESRNDTLYTQTHHFVSNNTPYKEIVNGVLSKRKYCYYKCNDIENEPNYLNSSIACYSNNKVPYKSELVMPILPLNLSQDTLLLLGFLCITCNNVNGFKLEEK